MRRPTCSSAFLSSPFYRFHCSFSYLKHLKSTLSTQQKMKTNQSIRSIEYKWKESEEIHTYKHYERTHHMEKGSNTLLDRRMNYNHQCLIQSHSFSLDPIHITSKAIQACDITSFAPKSSLTIALSPYNST